MKATIRFYAQSAATIALACLTAACASSPQDQFGIAVSRGNVPMAAANSGPNYANMQIWKTPRQYSVPMQYAIMQGNKPMASFLLANGAHHSLDGQNLALYSAANGRQDMAHFFIGRGIGSESDISRGQATIAANRQKSRASAQAGTLIGLSILAAMMHSGGGDQYNRNSSGFTEQEEHDMTVAEMEAQRENDAR